MQQATRVAKQYCTATREALRLVNAIHVRSFRRVVGVEGAGGVSSLCSSGLRFSPEIACLIVL